MIFPQHGHDGMDTFVHATNFAPLQIHVLKDPVNGLQMNVTVCMQPKPIAVSPELWSVCIVPHKIRGKLCEALILVTG